MKARQITIIGLCCTLGLLSSSGYAGWRDWLKLDTDKESTSAESTQSSSTAGLSNSDVIGGLKEALQKATGYAVSSLGAENGFLNNQRVRIPMPGALQKVESTLRSLGASRYADEFVATMNHAAEKAVVKAKPLFTKAVTEMTIEDGMKILKGSDDAATQYFRGKTESDLSQQMLPITKEMTSNSGVTASYKTMMDKLGFARSLVGEENVDLDQYVTQKAVDGLFLMVAEEEKKIRKDPVAQTSSLLKKVFGSL
jgi:hypothetical protein